MNRQTVGSDRIYQQAMMDQQQQFGVAPVPPPSLVPVNTRESKKTDTMSWETNYPMQPRAQPTIRMSQFQRMQQPQVQVQQYQPRVQQQQIPMRPEETSYFKPTVNTSTTESQWGFSLKVGVNPFDVLGLPRNTNDESVVDDTYRKWALILHPDRGGDPKKLQEINAAYEKVKEMFMHAKNESFEMLKSRAEYDLMNTQQINGGFMTGTKNGQANPELAPLGNGKNFDFKRFNNVFETHRMWNPHDDGYGDRMVNSEYNRNNAGVPTVDDLIFQRNQDDKAQVLMVDGYGQLMDIQNKKEYNEYYNNMFQRHIMSDQYQQHQRQNLTSGAFGPNGSQHFGQTGMVVRREPESAEMFRTSTSLCTALSVDKIDDFSSPFNGGAGASVGSAGYTDYMKAFSTDSLITPHVANAQGNGILTVEQLERERAQLSHIPSQEVLRERNIREAQQREADMERWRRYTTHAEKIEEHNAAIRNLLPDRTHVRK